MDTTNPLAHVVAMAGTIMGASTAILFAFRGRSRWEPSEQDLPAGPQRVGMLLAAVGVVVLWSTFATPAAIGTLRAISIWAVMATVLFLLSYGVLIATQTYTVVLSATEERKVVGGFWLTREARRERSKRKVTIQRLLAGAAYDPDRVWSRLSRALSKLAFVVCYLGLTAAGATALTAVALVVDLST